MSKPLYVKNRYVPCFSSDWTAHLPESSVPLSAKQGAILGKSTLTTYQIESTVQEVLHFPTTAFIFSKMSKNTEVH